MSRSRVRLVSVLQNRDDATFPFLGFQVIGPLWFASLAVLGVGIAIGMLLIAARPTADADSGRSGERHPAWVRSPVTALRMLGYPAARRTVRDVPGRYSQESNVSDLTVWKFDDVNGAEEALATLTELQKQGLIQIQDGAIVRWDEHRKKPKTVQMHNLAGIGAMSGAFWGMLFGLLFFVPLLGVAMGAALGAMSGSLADVGINDEFIKEIREKVTPGTSALFLLSAAGVRDRLAEAFEGTQVELLHTNFSTDEEAKLREVFEA